MARKPLIFCALDTADILRACDLAKKIGPVTGALKLGLEFFNAHGPDGIEQVVNACPSAALFLDLKYHDIPNTVSGSVAALSNRFKPAFLNVHAAGGFKMMAEAKAACNPATKLLGVTILTSLSQEDLKSISINATVEERVLELAENAKRSGLDGVVCSGHEIEILRRECGPDFILMVPGIRPEGAAAHDQKRVMTPKEAMQKGASHLVIGRPITEGADPAAAARAILDNLK